MNILKKPWKQVTKKEKRKEHINRNLKDTRKKENEEWREKVKEILEKKRNYVERMKEIERKKTEERIKAFKKRKR